MKTRNSFVSNSSSSSFVLVATFEAHDKIMAKLSETEQKIMKHLITENTFGNQKVKIFKDYCDAGGYYYHDPDNFDWEKAGIDEDDLEEPCDDFHEAKYHYQTAAEELKEEGEDGIVIEKVGDGG